MSVVKNDSGFTLIEVIIAMGVLSIGIFALYTLQLTSMSGNSKANLMTEAAKLGADQIETIISLDYDGFATSSAANPTISLTDKDGDGYGGINDATAAGADGTSLSDDKKYTLFWNIVDDYPIEGSKTIRVLTRDNNQKISNIVVVDYIKNGAI